MQIFRQTARLCRLGTEARDTTKQYLRCFALRSDDRVSSSRQTPTAETSSSDDVPTSSGMGSWIDREQHQDRHWLDRAFPGTREWLEAQNRRWWLRNVTSSSKNYQNLVGREKEIASLTETSYERFMAKHASKAIDDRAQTHLQVACLMLATKKVLQPFVRDSQEVLQMIKAQAGQHSSAFLHYLLRFSMFFARDPYASSVRRLKALRLDLGKSFTSDVNESSRSAELKIHSCLYNDVFQEEGAEELLGCCCCSQDIVWFDKLEGHGVGFQRREWLGSGNRCCTLELRKLR